MSAAGDTIERSRPVQVAATVVDVAMLAAAVLAVAGMVGAPLGDVRTVSSVLVAAFAPGWAMCRLAGVPVGGLMVFVSFALSATTMILLGQLLVTRLGWEWRAAGLLLCAGIAAALAVVLSRGRRG